MHNQTQTRTAYLFLTAAIGLLLAAECLLNLPPPISRDALIHHLAIPKLWLRHGSFYEIPWAKYSYYPMNIDLLYLICLYFKNDIAPKVIHLIFGFGTGYLVYIYVNKRLGHIWGLLGGLVFLSTPIVVRLCTAAYVDLGLIFFTTASILSFLQWQSTRYKRIRWFILSAVAMGLAAGCKYNAMIPWAFTNLIIVFYFARDTHTQGKAVIYGALFFAISMLLVSPWYVKNYLLTSNPLYPLFDSLFNPASHPSSSDHSTGMGFFQRRELMYGESFWETLLIPLRMFFQGRDHSGQYFDGVLNPILIIFAPFGFLKKDMRRDMVLFTAFTIFLMILAFFLAVPRVRYILPVVPLLAIATTIGIKSLLDYSAKLRQRWIRYAVFTAILGTGLACLTANGGYLKERFNAFQPLNYISGKVSREQFLTRHVGGYKAMQYINDHVPPDATVFLMFMAGRGYYLNRDYYHEASFGRKTITGFVNASMEGEQDFVARLRACRFSHILVRSDLLHKYLLDNFDHGAIARFLDLTDRYWNCRHESNGYRVLEVTK